MFIFGRFRVEGASMEPLYPEGSFVLCVAWFLPFRKGDVVVLEKNGRRILKRIARSSMSQHNVYFVLGDNTAESTDSRHFGAVKRKEILGKAFRLA